MQETWVQSLGWEDPLEEGMATLQYSCLENPMDRGAWRAKSMEISQARILEWVAMPSSRGSSQPRDQTQVSHIAGGFCTI